MQYGGKVWQYTGTPCNNENCSGWKMLDNNAATVEIAAGKGPIISEGGKGAILNNGLRSTAIGDAPLLYQLHNTGKIFRYTGTPCNGNSCPGWQMLDNDLRNRRIVAGGETFYRMTIRPTHLGSVRRLYKFTGAPCVGGTCSSWQLIAGGPMIKVAANPSEVYAVDATHNRMWRYNGAPCIPTHCPAWDALDKNPKTSTITTH